MNDTAAHVRDMVERRHAAMTPEQRKALASKAGRAASLARWRKTLKPGDRVRHGRLEANLLTGPDSEGAVRLDSPIEGFHWWSVDELVPPLAKKRKERKG